MKKVFMLLCTLLLSLEVTAVPVANASSKINWTTSYEDGLNQSKASSKPMLLFFTGSDWCSWCHKLEAEVLNTPEFGNSTSDKFIFVLLDFPMNSKLDSRVSAQNKELQKKYDVRGFPTIVLIDSKGQKIGVTGYRTGGGQQYAEHLFKMISDFSGLQQKLSHLDKGNFSGQELKHFYEKAQEFGLFQEANKIINIGFESDQRPFFLLERYRYLASEGQIKSEEAKRLKAQLLVTDPNNENLTHYQIAIIDFESLASLPDSQKNTADFFIAPLVSYIEKFGNQDKANLWRLEMIISQVYYDKDKPQESLAHAKLALEGAPLQVQPEIEIVINNFEKIESDRSIVSTLD